MRCHCWTESRFLNEVDWFWHLAITDKFCYFLRKIASFSWTLIFRSDSKKNGILPVEPTWNVYACARCALMRILQANVRIFPSLFRMKTNTRLRTHAHHKHLPIDSRRGLTASKTNLRVDDEAAAAAADEDDDGESCWCVCGRYFGLRCSKYPLAGDVLPPPPPPPPRSRSLLALVEATSKLDVGDGVE